MHARAHEGAAAVDFSFTAALTPEAALPGGRRIACVVRRYCTNSAAARLSCFGGLLKPTSLAVRKHSLTLTFPTLRSSPWVFAAANGNVSDVVS
jgi:hypothetical protein